MAQLSDNGLYTIEYGSSAWRVILNDNISKTLTEQKLANGINTNIKQQGDFSQTGNYTLSGDFSQTGNYTLSGAFSQTGNYTLSGNISISGTTLTTGVVTASDDIQFTDKNKGIILKDRSADKSYRLYIDGGNLNVEEIS